MDETGLDVDALTANLIRLGCSESSGLGTRSEDQGEVVRQILASSEHWARLADTFSQQELESLIRGLVIHSRLTGKHGGSVSPLIRLFAVYRLRFCKEQADQLSQWIVRNRINPYEPFGSAVYGNCTTTEEFEQARQQRRDHAATNSTIAALRNQEAHSLKQLRDGDRATGLLKRAVERGDAAAVLALLDRGADWRRVVAEAGSLQHIARAKGRNGVLSLLQSKDIP